MTTESKQWRLNEFESGGTGPERKWVHRSGANRRKKFFSGRVPPLFGSKSTMSRFDERFRDVQYSLVSFLFAVLLLTVPPCPAICKSGGTYPPVPMESAPLKEYKCVSITTNQPDTISNHSPNPNPTTKQHVIESIQLNILAYFKYPEKFIRGNVVAPFLQLSGCHCHSARIKQKCTSTVCCTESYATINKIEKKTNNEKN